VISDPAIANQISSMMLRVCEQLDESVLNAQGVLPDDEFRAYRRAVGAVMGEVLLTVLNPIFSKHPSLKPPGLE
jgi:hypothetical protein